MTKKEKVFIATREKEKGNEAFAIGDYVEAVTYYTRCVNTIVFFYFNDLLVNITFRAMQLKQLIEATSDN